jgi:hypothetical protein
MEVQTWKYLSRITQRIGPNQSPHRNGINLNLIVRRDNGTSCKVACFTPEKANFSLGSILNPKVRKWLDGFSIVTSK